MYPEFAQVSKLDIQAIIEKVVSFHFYLMLTGTDSTLLAQAEEVTSEVTFRGVYTVHVRERFMCAHIGSVVVGAVKVSDIIFWYIHFGTLRRYNTLRSGVTTE